MNEKWPEKIQRQLKRFSYRLKNDYLTLNNVVIAIAIVIGLSWTWSSIEVMQQNYELQQTVDSKKRQLALEQLRVDTLELETNYYKTVEYQELSVRERLGKGLPGEHLLIVPSTDEPTIAVHKNSKTTDTSNFQEWMNFLFGAKH